MKIKAISVKCLKNILVLQPAASVRAKYNGSVVKTKSEIFIMS